MTETKTTKVRLPHWYEALLPIVVLLVIMICNYIFEWGQDPHIPVLIAVVVAMAVGKVCGLTYAETLGGAVNALNRTMEAILVLFCIGTLIGTWMLAGTIPAVVYYGLNFITPQLFLPVAAVICAIIGISVGSSWTVTGTVGIAFMAIGAGLGFDPALTAGMCISGAYCGDKFSPLSDTTNLAAASSQTGLFDHVKAMISTTFPSFVIALIIYTILGMNASDNYDNSLAVQLQDTIVNQYDVMSPVLLVPVLVIILACVLKVPACPGILLATFTGAVFAMIFQGASFVDCISASHYGFSAETGFDLADELMNRGGMDSMLWTINLVVVAVGFGGVLERVGCVESLLGGLIRRVKRVGDLVLVTILTSLFCNWTMCDQYLALIIPGQMYMKKYDEMGLGRNMLSRTLEDCGTLWSPMCPWNSCGAYQASVLGMSPFTYMPYAFMNIINPIYAIVTAYLGRNILYADGTSTGLLSKQLKKGTPAAMPEDAREVALAALKEQRGA